MPSTADPYRDPLQRAHELAPAWLESIPSRQVAPEVNADAVLTAASAPLADRGQDPAEVVADLARIAEPGLMAIASGRFFGWVMGGTLPVALAADWLVSA